MSSTSDQPAPRPRGLRRFGTLLFRVGPLLIVALGLVAARALILSREAPPTRERTESATRVLVERVAYGTPQVTIPGYGVVEPRRSVSIRPTVGGPIVEVHPNLLAGGRIDRGAPLVVLDPRDFELAVAEAEADLASARANLDVELGNAAVAASEWELVEGRIQTDEAGRRLALREPFVERERAAVDTAQARLESARLDLERSVIRAPFDALVVSEDVEVGALATAGAELARLVDRSEFLVVASLQADRLGSLATEDAPVLVTRVGDQPRATRLGHLAGILGEVDPVGRMARVQVALGRPLDGSLGPPMLLGDYVRVDLPLEPIGRVASIPRTALREGDRVWIADDSDRLEIRAVEVVLRRDDDVLVASGVEEGARILLGALAVPLPGMRLDPIETQANELAEAGGGEAATQ